MIFNCVESIKNHKKGSNKYLIKEFANTYEFCVGNINEICLMLRKSANLYEYMDSSKIFDETSLPEKEEFYSNLNMKDITAADYKHAKRL